MAAETSQTLDRGLRVLEVVAESPDGLTVTELAAALGIGRTVVYRLVVTLEQHAFLRRSADGRCRLGLGILAGVVCFVFVAYVKHRLKLDDSLDVFGVHGIGGIVGALLTGVFNSPALGGPSLVGDWVTASMVSAADYSIANQVWVQLKGVLITIVWSGVVSIVAYKIVDLTIGLRVSEEDEREGLDITSHGETAYSR